MDTAGSIHPHNHRLHHPRFLRSCSTLLLSPCSQATLLPEGIAGTLPALWPACRIFLYRRYAAVLPGWSAPCGSRAGHLCIGDHNIPACCQYFSNSPVQEIEASDNLGGYNRLFRSGHARTPAGNSGLCTHDRQYGHFFGFAILFFQVYPHFGQVSFSSVIIMVFE